MIIRRAGSSAAICLGIWSPYAKTRMRKNWTVNFPPGEKSENVFSGSRSTAPTRALDEINVV